VAALPVLTALDILDDPRLEVRRRNMQVASFARRGLDFLVYGIPWHLSETPSLIRRPLVPAGADNEYIFGTLLKPTRDEIQALID
jgi:crotonobetainyl-CoA:carnitine CoA-transferase CaiB-like acyl-CoA transferase